MQHTTNSKCQGETKRPHPEILLWHPYSSFVNFPLAGTLEYDVWIRCLTRGNNAVRLCAINESYP